jgi:ABC-2 type transport system ATP-binding protein
MHEPKLLILDEPTAGVDIEIRRSMWTYLRDLNARGATIILTTHYLEEAESLCRNIGIIDEGELIESTSMKHLLSQLDTETFVLDTRQPVSELPKLIPDCVRLLDETTLEADISRECSINFLFEQLSRHNIEVLSMRNKTNRLEQLFMRMVEGNGVTEHRQ